MRPGAANPPVFKPGTFRVLKRDFADQSCCSFCQHPLRSSLGFKLLKGQSIFTAGPDCAEKFGRTENLPIPDLVEALLMPVPGETELAADRQPLPEAGGEAASLKRALEYVLLCQEALPALGIDIEPFQPAKAAYTAYRQNRLTPESLQPVIRRMETIGGSRPDLSYRRLSHQYVTASMIDRCLARPNLSERAAGWLREYRTQLVERSYLSAIQMTNINRHITNLFGESSPRLEPNAFVRLNLERSFPLAPSQGRLAQPA